MVHETTKRLMTRVKHLRLALGLTQEQFAERAGLDYKTYQHVEAGRRPNPEMDTLIKLAKGCGVEIRQLFDFDAPMIVAEVQGNEVAATPRKDARKPARRRIK